MTNIETYPGGIFKGNRFRFTHLENVPIEDKVIKARKRPEPTRNPFKRISLKKMKWVPFHYKDSEQKVRLIDIKVSHAAKLFGVKKQMVRRAAKHDRLEQMIMRSLWISLELPLSEVQDRAPITDESFNGVSLIEESENIDNLKIQKLTAICASEGLGEHDLQVLTDFIHTHLDQWEENNEESVYFHRLDTGLPRSVFWIRGQGAYIKLKGSDKELQTNKLCRKLKITREEYLDIRRYINKRRYYWDANPYRMFVISKKKSGLVRKLMYRPCIGLYIENFDGTEWVFSDQKKYDKADISHGSYKNVFKGVQLKTGAIVAIGSSGRMLEDAELIPGNIGITDEEKYAHEILHHQFLNKGAIIEYDGVKDDPSTDKRIVKRALISEFFPLGDLSENLKFLTLSEKLRIAKDLMEALVYLHTKTKVDGTTSWLHLDIKPKNILLVKIKGKKRALLCDFSFTGPEEEKTSFKGGTLSYVAPEILSKKQFGKVGTHTDIWESGVTLYQLFSEELPDWSKVRSGNELKSVFEEGNEIESGFNELKINPEIVELLKGMLQIDAKKRLTAKECLEVLNRLQL